METLILTVFTRTDLLCKVSGIRILQSIRLRHHIHMGTLPFTSVADTGDTLTIYYGYIPPHCGPNKSAGRGCPEYCYAWSANRVSREGFENVPTCPTITSGDLQGRTGETETPPPVAIQLNRITLPSVSVTTISDGAKSLMSALVCV